MPPTSTQKKGSAARGGGRTRGRRGASHEGEEHDGSERWLVTYADLLTVLLALFIVLFAISALNESKFEQLKYSLAAVFGDGSIGVLDGSPAINATSDDNRVPQPPDTPDVPTVDNPLLPAVPTLDGLDGTDTPVKDQTVADPQYPIDTGSEELDRAIAVELESFEKIKREIDLHLEDAGMQGSVSYAIDSRGLIVTVVTNALVFPGNSATLLPRGERLLAAIAPAIKKVSNDVEVDGFTNQVDVDTYPFPSGWELSSARASAVVRYLEAHGLDDRQLSAVGFSDQKPLVDPKDPASVTRNRRVEIVVLSSLPSTAGTAMAEAAAAEESVKKRAGDGRAGQGTTQPGSDDGPAPPEGQAARGVHQDSTREPDAAARTAEN